MATHEATIHWQQKEGENFLKGQYSREHTWDFDGGIQVLASPSPSVVPVPFSNPAAVDPEEAFVASIASCHMLTFLYEAGKKGYHVMSYSDHAIGKMTKAENGVPWLSEITLYPKITYSPGSAPAQDVESKLHEDAHHQCFIANSVKTNIQVAT
ncbi:MAG: organic hydroperoxide reductase OsmC/OhrA [Verrucomicrobiales bacterium]|jgi:organic hydroperoxide reductase OsmC/OhrA